MTDSTTSIPVVTVDIPNTTVLVRPVRLSAPHDAALCARAREELSRYPTSVRAHLPEFVLLDRVETALGRIRATYLHEANLAVVTPSLDFRGNIHRAAAASLLRRFPEAARQLVAEGWGAETSTAVDLYPAHSLDSDGQVCAMIAAVILNRSSLSRFAASSAEFAVRLSLVKEFLFSAGFTAQDVQQLPPCPMYAYLVDVAGAFPRYSIEPDGVGLHMAAPGEGHNDYTFVALDASDATSVLEQVRDDVWVVPEGLLHSTVRDMHLVRDVRRSDCDVAGYASSRRGEPATLVVEVGGQRSIFSHEFGHAIHFRFHDQFPEARWRSFVPADAGYLGSGHDYIKSGLHEAPFSPSLLDRGFITGYASASLAEDVAEMVEALLVGDARLWSAIEDAPKLAGKLACLIEFLHAVDPVFDREYFEALAQNRVREEGLRSR